MEENEFKRLLNYINGLSPWNLWHPHDVNKPIEKRRFNPKNEDIMKKLKND